MSKASDWAKAPTFPREDLIGQIGPVHDAQPVVYPERVTCQIKSLLGYGTTRYEVVELTTDEALALARWILDTFGETA